MFRPERSWIAEHFREGERERERASERESERERKQQQQSQQVLMVHHLCVTIGCKNKILGM